MRALMRAALAALSVVAPATVVATAAQAAAAPPGIVVLNGAGTLTSYPLRASGDAPPTATVSSDSSSDLHQPIGIALDAAGNAWVTNQSNTIDEYSKAALAAGGSPAPTIRITSDAQNSLDLPTGLAFDGAGDLWVANPGNDTLVEYTATQLAAGGAQTPAVTITSDSSRSIAFPYFIAFDAGGNLWVPNEANSTLVEFTRDQLTASGDPTPAVTLSDDGTGHLDQPISVSFDSAGDLWAASSGAGSLVEYSPSELVTGSPSPVKSLADSFPFQTQFDPTGDLWVTDPRANRVDEFDAAQLAAGGSPTPAQTIMGNGTGLDSPESLAIEQAPVVSSLSVTGGPSGTSVPISGAGFNPGSTVDFGGAAAASVKYVSPYQLSAVAPVGTGTVDVTVTTTFGSSATSPADRFTYSSAPSVPPTVVAGNDATGTLTSFPFSASGNVSPAATLSDNGSGSVAYPIDGTLDAAGDLWVPNNLSGSVVEFTKRQLIGGGPQPPVVRITSDGAGSLASPSGAAFDPAGNLWVTDAAANTVVEYAKAQLATGGAQVPAVTLQSDASNSLDSPYGLDFDASGNLWVANFAGTVVEYSRAQLAAGGSPVPAVTLSADASSSLATPDALTFDRRGDLWVTNGEAGNSLVEYTPGQLVTGAPTPAVTIASDAAGSLNGSDQAQFDAAGDLWVADFDPLGNAGSIVEFAPGQLASSGSPTPVDTITGDATGLGNPWALVIEQAPTVSSISPTDGPAAGGTSVTISGTGFYPGSTVDFGGVPAASVTYVSPYDLTAVAPAGSGRADVTVTTGEGTSGESAADQFTYLAASAGSPPSAVAVSAPALVPRVGSGSHQLKVSGHFVAVPVSCSVAACQGTVRLVQRVVVTVRHGKRRVQRVKTVVLASAHYTLSAGQHRVLELRLSPGALTALAHARLHRVAAGLIVTVSGGTTFNESVVLARPVKRATRTG